MATMDLLAQSPATYRDSPTRSQEGNNIGIGKGYNSYFGGWRWLDYGASILVLGFD
jgi:hypothetical protein